MRQNATPQSSAANVLVHHTPQLPHNQHAMASQDVATIATTVRAQFTQAHTGQHKCRHCGAVAAQRWSTLRAHLAWCKSLPDSVRAVLDHAAVCESRAGLGCYGGVYASVYRGFRVTGWGVNECRRCGKVIQGWQSAMRRHIDGKRCVVGEAAATAATKTPGALRSGTTHSVTSAAGRRCAAKDCAPKTTSCSTIVVKRRRPARGSDCAGPPAQGSWPHQPRMRSGSGSGCSRHNRALQQPRQQATQTAHAPGACCSGARHGAGITTRGQRAVNAGVAWAHGFTMTMSGLKVPLAPIPSRCKRARRARSSGDSNRDCEIGASGGCSSCGSGVTTV